MNTNKVKVVIGVLIVALVALVVARVCAPSGQVPQTAVKNGGWDSEFGPETTEKPSKEGLVGKTPIVSNGGRGGGGGKRRSGDAGIAMGANDRLSGPQETEQALRNAIAAKDQQGLADLLQRMRNDRDGHADVIRRLALDANAPMIVRLAMVGLMREMRDRESLDALLVLSRDGGEPALRAETLKALGVRSETEAENRLREVAADSADPGRAMALSLMGGNGGDESREALLAVGRQSGDAKHEDVNAALYSLRHYHDDETVKTLLAVAEDQDLAPRLRATALYSLGVTGAPEALSAIKANLASPEREIRYSAVLASVRVSDAEVSASLVGQLCDTGNYPHVRKAASASLSKNATAADLKALRKSVAETDGFGIILAGDVFTAKEDKEALPLLRSLSETTPDTHVIEKLNAVVIALTNGEGSE